MMVVPLFLFNCITCHNFTDTQQQKLKSLDIRANNIVYGQGRGISKFPQLNDVIRRHACNLVKTILTGNVCRNFINYYTMNEHNINTRNQGFLMKVPKVKLEFAKYGFFFMGANIFNTLPLEIRQTPDLGTFHRKVSNFSWQ